MENRPLPILHKSLPLCKLCVSNESFFWDEWVVKRILQM